MANLSEDIQCAGSDTRPPMLDRTDFALWQQRIRLGKENGVNILKSIDEGPFQMGTFRETLAEGNEGALHLGPERARVYSDLSPEDKDRYNADIRATNILLQGLPKDIYTLINHYTDAKDIWDNVKMLLEGSELTKEDRESQLYDDFEHFRQNKGETIHDYYVRFAKLINDMRNIKMTMSRMQLNSKFVNNMLPEWGRFVTAVKLNRGLRDSNYDQLYAYLKQHEAHANENKMMLDRFTQHTVDPLALMYNVSHQQYYSQSSTTPPSTHVQPHFSNNTQLDSGLSPTNNLIENLTNTLPLLKTPIILNIPTSKNNHLELRQIQETSYRSRCRVGVQIVQGQQNRGQGIIAWGEGAAGYGGVLTKFGMQSGHARQIKCYNCNAQENEVALDEEQLLFYYSGTRHVLMKMCTKGVIKADDEDKKGNMGVRNSQNNCWQVPLLKLGEYEMWEKDYAVLSDSKICLWEASKSLLSRLASWCRYFPEDLMWKFLRSLPSEWDTHVVENVFNCHKNGTFARESRVPKGKDNRNWNQGNSSKAVRIEDASEKAMCAIDGGGFDWSDMAEDEVQANMALMAFTDSEVTDQKQRGFGYYAVPSPHPILTDQTPLGLVYSGLRNSTLPDEKIDWVSDDEEEVESIPKEEKKANVPIATEKESVKPVSPSRKSIRSVNTVRPVSTARFVNTVRPYNTAHPKPTISCARPKTSFSNHAKGPFTVKALPLLQENNINKKSNSQLNEKGFVDSGCSRHMSGNIAHLSDFKEFDGGYVTFGGGANGGRITGKGTIKTDKLDFEDVYFVKELKFNLFSVSQMCDKKNYVLFTDSECLVLSPNFKLPDESQVLLNIPRQNNMYSFDMKNIVPKDGLTCLFSKATSEESMLWHRRLGHVNFKNINKLVKENLVRDLPLKRFENDQTVACLKASNIRASCKDQVLLTKDETSEILKNFIKEIENLVDKKVKIIRSDNGTEFKNHVMDEFCREKGIKREYSVARTPQQNGVAERKNRTLIEAARTMLADSKLPTTFWAEAVSTACYVQNRVLVVKPHNKTPYELFRGIKPAIGFMKPFGCHVTILNTLDKLGKFDGKSDEGFFVGYSLSSKAFRVYNIRTRKVQENLHVGFLENKPMLEGNGPKWLFDLDSLTQSMNYVPVVAGSSSNVSAGIQEVSESSTPFQQDQDCIIMPIWKDASYFDDASLKSVADAQIQDQDVTHDDCSFQDNGIDDQQVNTASPQVNTGSRELSTAIPEINTANPEGLMGPILSLKTHKRDQALIWGIFSHFMQFLLLLITRLQGLSIDQWIGDVQSSRANKKDGQLLILN
ncbi:ribonuclease H-like domain-containing protein [Tanacetum coccineum]